MSRDAKDCLAGGAYLIVWIGAIAACIPFAPTAAGLILVLGSLLGFGSLLVIAGVAFNTVADLVYHAVRRLKHRFARGHGSTVTWT
jgi:hypothetical protein